MANTSFNNVKISGIVTVVPQIVKSIDDEIDLYGGNQKQIDRIKKAIGLDQRRVTDADTTSVDLCEAAAKKLFKGLDLNKRDVDGLIFVTQTPDHFQPSNAAIIHGCLGLDNACASFDINLGCSGYVYGLWMAHMMVASGTCNKVLLLAGDTISKYVNPRDRSTAPLFGDAGSATLIEETEVGTKSFFSLHTDGSGNDFIKVPAGGFRCPATEQTAVECEDTEGNWRSQNDIYMNGGEVFNFSIKTEPAAINEILEYSQKTIDDIDHVVFHQANKYIITNIAKRLKLPLDKVPCETVSKYGNQSSASIPSTINDALSAKVSTSQQDIILSGFGVGLSWASASITLDNIYCPSVQIYSQGEKK
jgi:3-oxoacyl-[acyl-carrier-protein] synthase III